MSYATMMSIRAMMQRMMRWDDLLYQTGVTSSLRNLSSTTFVERQIDLFFQDGSQPHDHLALIFIYGQG